MCASLVPPRKDDSVDTALFSVVLGTVSSTGEQRAQTLEPHAMQRLSRSSAAFWASRSTGNRSERAAAVEGKQGMSFTALVWQDPRI